MCPGAQRVSNRYTASVARSAGSSETGQPSASSRPADDRQAEYVPPMTEDRKTDDALAAYPLDLAQHAFAFVQRLPRLRTRTGWVCLTASPDVSSGTRDLRGCPREPDCARGAQPMPVGIGEHLSVMWPRGRRANPRSPGRPKWLGPSAGCRRSLQRQIVDALGRPGETSGLVFRPQPPTIPARICAAVMPSSDHSVRATQRVSVTRLAGLTLSSVSAMHV